MFSDLDKSLAYIYRKSFKEGNLDIFDADTLEYSALYGDLLEKKEGMDNIPYNVPVNLPVEDDGVINIRPLLLLDGIKFINTIYMTILGRVPERSAVTALMNALAEDSGKEAKLEYIKRLCSSQEAEQRGELILTGFDSIDIRELYKYSDIEFVENAYINILFRKPDIEGKKLYLSLLRSSEYSAAEILYTLRHSPEGEMNGVNIIGLDEEYNKRMKRKKLLNTPVIGKCGKHIYNLINLNKRMNSLEAENYSLKDQLHFNRVELFRQIAKTNEITGKIAAR